MKNFIFTTQMSTLKEEILELKDSKEKKSKGSALENLLNLDEFL